MMCEEASLSLRVSRVFTAGPDRVFDAWLDPDSVGRWLFATPTGQVVRVEIDARVGGKFVIVDRRDGVDVEHIGEYIEIDRPNRLVFTFSVPMYSPVVTRVTIDFAARDEGSDLMLTHDGVLSEWESQARSGWTSILEALEKTIA